MQESRKREKDFKFMRMIKRLITKPSRIWIMNMRFVLQVPKKFKGKSKQMSKLKIINSVNADCLKANSKPQSSFYTESLIAKTIILINFITMEFSEFCLSLS